MSYPINRVSEKKIHCRVGYATIYPYYGLFVGQKSLHNGSHTGPYFKDTRDIPKCFRKMARPFHCIDIDNVL